jgi:hypothetical protein
VKKTISSITFSHMEDIADAIMSVETRFNKDNVRRAVADVLLIKGSGVLVDWYNTLYLMGDYKELSDRVFGLEIPESKQPLINA